MREVLYEETAEASNLKLHKTLYVIYTVVFYATVAIGIFFLIFVLMTFDLAALIFTAFVFLSAFLFWYLRGKIYYCVDCIFVSGSTRIIKVVNYRRRRKMIIFEAKEVKTVGRAASETFEKIYKTPGVKKIYATPNREGDFFYVFLNQNGADYLVILECKEDYLKHLVAYAGRSVVEKDYK